MKRTKEEPQCTDQEIGHQIYMEVFNAAHSNREIELLKEQQDHLTVCAHCACSLPIWKLKQSNVTLVAKTMVDEAQAGTTEILWKHCSDINAYFKPTEGSRMGILVKATVSGKFSR